MVHTRSDRDCSGGIVGTPDGRACFNQCVNTLCSRVTVPEEHLSVSVQRICTGG